MVKMAWVFVGRGLRRRRFARQSDEIAWRSSHSIPRPVVDHAWSCACRNRGCGQGIQRGRRLRILIVRRGRRSYLGRVDRRRGGVGSRNALCRVVSTFVAVVDGSSIYPQEQRSAVIIQAILSSGTPASAQQKGESRGQRRAGDAMRRHGCEDGSGLAAGLTRTCRRFVWSPPRQCRRCALHFSCPSWLQQKHGQY